MPFQKTLAAVEDQGMPPIRFLNELVEWGRVAPEDIFAPRKDPALPMVDVYNRILPFLGEWHRADDKFFWRSPLHRRAAMLELMRVHGGFESGWKWMMGVDTTNKRSMANKTGQETGLWQVSFDSTFLDKNGEMNEFCSTHGIDKVNPFITKMKEDHRLAMEYYARLMRYSYKWAGPVIRHSGDSINGWLRRDAEKEFEQLLSQNL